MAIPIQHAYALSRKTAVAGDNDDYADPGMMVFLNGSSHFLTNGIGHRYNIQRNISCSTGSVYGKKMRGFRKHSRNPASLFIVTALQINGKTELQREA